MENWLWSDLKIGDKVKIRDEVIKNYRGSAWADEYGNIILKVVDVQIVWAPVISIYVSPVNLNRKGHFCVHPDTGIERTAHAGGQFFEIIELAKD